MLNVVTINGGRGAASIIPQIVSREGLSVTSIVNAYDDGKSTGEIRNFFQMLGPSDIRKVQELLLPKNDSNFAEHLRLFQYRFPLGCSRIEAIHNLSIFANTDAINLLDINLFNVKVKIAIKKFIKEFLDNLSIIERVSKREFVFSDCSLMNCIYAGAFVIFNRNLEDAVIYIDKLFQLQGSVLPSSIENKVLTGLRDNGEMLYSEAEIVELRSNALIEQVYLLDLAPNRIYFDSLSIDEKRFYLNKHQSFVRISNGVELAIKSADIIIYSAGTQHSSLYPTYLSSGLSEAIANSGAFKVFITNIGADYETPFYKASDYINGAFRYLSMSKQRRYIMQDFFDLNIINISNLKSDETYVDYDPEAFVNIPVHCLVDDFESRISPGKHDGSKVISTILDRYQSQSSLI
jgi:2-phospho-L-lactate transferase/gluconeogenesis factor (CofD/UPF0052 family)